MVNVYHSALTQRVRNQSLPGWLAAQRPQLGLSRLMTTIGIMTIRRTQRRVGSRRTNEDGYKLPATKHQLREYPLSSSDIQLLTRAVAQQWEVPRAARAAVVELMQGILLNDPDPQRAIRAARVIVAAERQNQLDRQKRRKSFGTEVVPTLPQVAEPACDLELIRRRKEELMAEAAETKIPEANTDGRLPGISGWQQQFIDFAGRADQTDDRPT